MAKSTPKINLHTLACELARKDAKGGHNQSVIGAETTLAALGDRLRNATAVEAIEILGAIVGRGGKSKR